MATKALVAASSKPLILSILAHGESYGYEIIKKVEELSGGELEWTDAMLYPVLHRMEGDGFIQSKWVVADNGRRRKYYELTAKGQEELEAEKSQWMNVHEALKSLWNTDPKLSLE
ncbi:MAG: helix-turn-helix transcriptional regulator [Gracilimonas sp.]|nr:helix-turn-helix transcriptional regulator [Gracilimonas sp.]